MPDSLPASVYWLFVVLSLYWGYCLFWGVTGLFRARTATDYFIAGRSMPPWLYVLAATATSYSAWTFMGHPALVWRDGLPYAFASLYAITIPFAGLVFMKRAWLLGKRHGYVTPGEMFADYFGGEGMRTLTVLVALVYAVPYVGLQLRASGVLFEVLTHNLVSAETGMWMLTTVLFLYVALGGLRSVAYVDVAQLVLLLAGITILGAAVLVFSGGWSAFLAEFSGMVRDDLALGHSSVLGEGVKVLNPDGGHRLTAVPGVIQWVSGAEEAQGSGWTGVMIFSYLFALMGIQASPAFIMWAFSNDSPRSFAPQQVWGSAFAVGGCLVVFTVIEGLGGWVLLRKGLLPLELLTSGAEETALVPALIQLLSDAAPWLVGLLAVSALAAMQSTGSAYLATASGMLTRDLYVRRFNPRATASEQKLCGRVTTAVLCLCSLSVATFSTDALVMLGGLAVSYGAMMWIPLVATLYVPWLTRPGVTWGLLAGLAVVTLTYPFHWFPVPQIRQFLGIGPYPLTFHCAGWGILANALVAVLVSAATQPGAAERARRRDHHRFLRFHAGLPPHKAHLKPVAWLLTLTWLLYGMGPFTVLGNDFLGLAHNPDTWPLGVPPLWLWLGVWWALGVALLWFLAYRMEFSTYSGSVAALREDYCETYADGAEEGSP